MVEMVQLATVRVAHLKMPAPPDKWLGADHHGGKGTDQCDARGVGPAIKQPKQAWLGGEHPLPEGVVVLTGFRLANELNYYRASLMSQCRLNT